MSARRSCVCWRPVESRLVTSSSASWGIIRPRRTASSTVSWTRSLVMTTPRVRKSRIVARLLRRASSLWRDDDGDGAARRGAGLVRRAEDFALAFGFGFGFDAERREAGFDAAAFGLEAVRFAAGFRLGGRRDERDGPPDDFGCGTATSLCCLDL